MSSQDLQLLLINDAGVAFIVCVLLIAAIIGVSSK